MHARSVAVVGVPSLVLVACGELLSLGTDPTPRDAPAVTDGAASADAGVIADAGVDGATEGGPADAAPLCPGAPSCTRHVFVTGPVPATALQGDTADDTCMAAVSTTNQAELRNRRYRAWVSTSARPAAGHHVHGTGPYIDARGIEIAANWTALTTGEVQITIDELGAGHSSPEYVWTGTSANGSYAPPSCNDWTSTQNGVQGMAGIVAAAGGNWSAYGRLSCAQPAMVYCIEE